MKPLKRHYRLINFVRPFIRFFVRFKYGYEPVERFELRDTPILLLCNHVTQIDPILTSLSFKQHIYYVATENVFARGWISKLLVYFLGPIKKVKNEIDIAAIRDVMSMAKNKGSVGIFLSGNATYSGVEEYIESPIAGLAKRLKLPIVLFNLYGLYGVSPRWAHELRKGKCYGDIKRILYPEEYLALSDAELQKIIKEGLNVSSRDNVENEAYDCSARAEYLERALFLCPRCSRFQTLRSDGHILKCRHCGYAVEYEPDLTFKALSGERYFKTVKEWYDYEKNYVANYDFGLYNERAILSDKNVFIRDIHREKKGRPGDLYLYNDRLEVLLSNGEKIVAPFNEITSAAAQSKNNLLFKRNKITYEINGPARRSALAYVFIYYAIKTKGEQGHGTDRFLGI